MSLLLHFISWINVGQISATNLTNHNHFFNFTDRCCSKCILPIDLTKTLFTWCLTGQCTLVNTRMFMFENLIEFTELRHYVVHTVCTAFISQTTDKPLNWLEEKNKDFNFWICYGVQWSVLMLLPISCFDFSPVHSKTPTTLILPRCSA